MAYKANRRLAARALPVLLAVMLIAPSACPRKVKIVTFGGQTIETKDRVVISAVKALQVNQQFWPVIQATMVNAVDLGLVDGEVKERFMDIDQHVFDIHNLMVDALNLYVSATNDDEKKNAITFLIAYQSQLTALVQEAAAILERAGVPVPF